MGGSGSGRKPELNWDSLRKEFYRAHKESGIRLKPWAREKGISYNVVRKYIDIKAAKAAAKSTKTGEYQKNRQEFRDVVRKLAIEDEGRHYIKSMKQSIVLLEDIMVESGAQFKWLMDNDPDLSSTDAAKLVIASSQALRNVAMELQGVPDYEDAYGWPLTKGFWPLPYQQRFIFDLPSHLKMVGEDAFLFTFIGGIGSGKTYAGAQKAGDLAFRNRGCQGAIFAPTYRVLRDSTLSKFFQVLNDKGISYKYLKSDNSITIFGDTKILCRSMEEPDYIRGIEIAWFWQDEPGQMKDREAHDIIMGRVRDPNATEPCGLITTTPDGFNWLYDVVIEEGEKNKVKLYRARTDQNIYLGKEFYERLKDTYDERFAKQELYGEFLDVFAGQAYWNFTRKEHVVENLPYDPTLPIILAFDLNVDPMCWGVIQSHLEGNHYVDHIIDELHIRTAGTEVTAKEFLARYRNHKAGVTIYGDATCRARKTSATRTDYEIIKDILKPLPLLEMKIGNANPRVTDRITAMNARLKDMNGRIKLLVAKKCKHTIRDFERVAFKEGTRDLDKTDPALTHHTDGVGYYVFREYPVRKPKVMS